MPRHETAHSPRIRILTRHHHAQVHPNACEPESAIALRCPSQPIAGRRKDETPNSLLDHNPYRELHLDYRSHQVPPSTDQPELTPIIYEQSGVLEAHAEPP